MLKQVIEMILKLDPRTVQKASVCEFVAYLYWEWPEDISDIRAKMTDEDEEYKFSEFLNDYELELRNTNEEKAKAEMRRRYLQ